MRLIEAQAAFGASTILLSATLPADTKRRFLAPYGGTVSTFSTAYPLATTKRIGAPTPLEIDVKPRTETVRDVPLEHARGEIKDIKHEDLLTGEDTAVDVALWGRMLAAAPKYNVTAACSVSHAITTHAVTVEQDYFTARDERPQLEQGSGAGHLDVKHFGSGVYYTYVCLDRTLLLSNLGGNTELRDAAIDGLIRAATTVSPGGMQSTMASQAYAAYALVEVGDQQPRTMHPAFAQSVRGADMLEDFCRQTRELQRHACGHLRPDVGHRCGNRHDGRRKLATKADTTGDSKRTPKKRSTT